MSDRKPLPIYPGTSNPKSAFTLDDFLRNWSDFAVRKPFIILVGSLANWEKTQGDIDILIKAKDPTPLIDALDSIIVKMFDQKEESTADVLIAVQKFIATDSLFLNAKWRIERAFPAMSENMHILDDSFSGPFTNFVELSDLVSFSREIKIRQEMKCSESERSVITKVLSKHRRDRCMKCVDPPEFEVSWAEGHAHAWLCEKHLKKFVKDSFDECIKAGEEIINCASDIIGIKKINDGEAAKKYDENKNPDLHTKFIEEARTEISNLLRHSKELSTTKKVVLFKPVPLLKPIHGRSKGEIYSVDSVIETVKSRKDDWFKVGIAVQKKFDGVHCQADKKGKEVRIWTEEGTEITKNCPSIVKELSAISSDFKLIGEMELWKGDKHQNRAVTAGVLNTKEVDSDEKFLVFNLFDCLYHKSQDIHMLPYSERLHHLKSFLFVKKERVKLVETRIVKTESELRDALAYFSKLEGSEGAYLKKLNFAYSLSGKTTENMKFKNELSVDVQIVKVNVVGARTKK
jgi:hypothetical protein